MLVVRDPLDVAVLLYEGEEIHGAQQNQLLEAPFVTAEAVGLGEAQRFDHGGLTGRALRVDGELVALTAGS